MARGAGPREGAGSGAEGGRREFDGDNDPNDNEPPRDDSGETGPVPFWIRGDKLPISCR